MRNARFLLAMTTLALAGCGKSSDPPAPVAKAPETQTASEPAPPIKETPPPAKVAEVPQVAAAFSLTADALIKDYLQNRPAAVEKYGGKIIELTGVVKNVGREFTGTAYLHLEGAGDVVGVTCYPADPEPWGKIVPGQSIKLRGTGEATGAEAILRQCVFIETGPGLAIVVSAEQLAQEYAADREAATKKYANKYLLVSGEIAQKDAEDSGAAKILLKGVGNVRVRCQFPAAEEDWTRSMRSGQQLRALGQYSMGTDPNEAQLTRCLPLTNR
jgi:uncharacterized protein (DUF1330 family)